MTEPLSIRPTLCIPGAGEDFIREFAAPLKGLVAKFGRINTPGSQMFCSDNMMLLARNMSFLEDERLISAVRDNARDEIELSIIWRIHVLCWAAGTALSLVGDLVECGTYRGYSAAVLAQYHDLPVRTDRRFFLYDTFNPSGAPGEGRRLPGHSDQLYAEVQARFAAAANIIPVQGRIPEVFAETCPDRISFLHIDLNDAAAERAALAVLFDRVVPRGVIVFDDYGWVGYRASRDAVQEFMAARGQMVVELPTGQGMVIKT